MCARAEIRKGDGSGLLCANERRARMVWLFFSEGLLFRSARQQWLRAMFHDFAWFLLVWGFVKDRNTCRYYVGLCEDVRSRGMILYIGTIDNFASLLIYIFQMMKKLRDCVKRWVAD